MPLFRLGDGGLVRVMVTEQQVGQAREPTLGDVSQALIAAVGTDYGLRSATWISRFTAQYHGPDRAQPPRPRTEVLRETVSELLAIGEPRKRIAGMMSGLDITTTLARDTRVARSGAVRVASQSRPVLIGSELRQARRATLPDRRPRPGGGVCRLLSTRPCRNQLSGRQGST